MNATPRRLRTDLPFRRVALVLSGGGALGAYEVGVFRALEHAGLEPRIVLGVSVGAINGLIWVANGFGSDALRRTWSQLRPPSIGIRWETRAIRALGAFLLALAALEALLTLGELPQLGVTALLARSASALAPAWNEILLDTLAWLLVAALGAALLLRSGRFEDALVKITPAADPERVQRVLGRWLIVLALLFPIPLLFRFAWPQRFHLFVLLLGTLVWLVSRAMREDRALRRFALRLLPETGGRGLWRTGARRRLIEELLPPAARERLARSDVRLILTACEIESGRIHYFVNWRDPAPEFRARIERSLGVVRETRGVGDLIEAALASSAVPVVFEPVKIGALDFIDAGVFSNQPLHAVIADGADALLMVLVSPSGCPPRLSAEPNLIEIAARLSQIANWRDLQTEMQRLPPGWTREGDPARVCVVEPTGTLPGSLLGIDPATAAVLTECGERDAWDALERAGWLAADPRVV
ncbi:MAG: patatin-like phospholipase family protein [Candidatus Eisenbacteria bacterium]|nr:patatin-like phospholipase family protein [Candidatus Eisenbacteria bacterium]